MTNSSAHAGKHLRPLHPPFTHFPIAAYVFAAGFDVISVIGGSQHAWANQLWHAGTYVLVGGLAICLVTMLTGFADLVRFGERRPAAIKTLAVHVCVMAAVFMIGVGDIAVRISDSHQTSTPPVALILTVAAAIGACTGGFFGGTLVHRYGTGVAGVRAAAEYDDATAAHEQAEPDLRTLPVRHQAVRHRAPRDYQDQQG